MVPFNLRYHLLLKETRSQRASAVIEENKHRVVCAESHDKRGLSFIVSQAKL